MKAQTNTLSAEEAELLKIYQKLGSEEKADFIELMKTLLKNQSVSTDYGADFQNTLDGFLQEIGYIE